MNLPKNKWLIAALAWFIAGIYALIFRESSTHTPPPFLHFDKLAHFLLFFAQTWLAAKIWLVANKKPPLMVLLTLGLMYAIASELAQHFFTTTRQGDVWDAVADMCGVLMALHLAKIATALKKI